jgi:DNA repair photolyase
VRSVPKDAPIRGRGAGINPSGRFERLEYVRDPESSELDGPAPKTQFLKDSSRTIIAYNESPDVGFNASINPYRGCEHGCIYCYARPTHEYLGFSAGLDFETRILVKEDAPELLREELSSRGWKPQVLGISGVTDAYQPIESRLQLTRKCLEVLAEYRNPVVIITKNQLVARDIDLLSRLAQFNAVKVMVSITTLDAELARTLEPRTSSPALRLSAIETVSNAGVPVGVMVAPVIPGLNDHEILPIISAAAKAGAGSAGYTVVRLPYGVADLFEQWLTDHMPDRKKKVLSRIRDIRGGRLNDPNFGSRMKGQGVYSDQIRSMFTVACRRAGIEGRRTELSSTSFRRPSGMQPSLFEQE